MAEEKNVMNEEVEETVETEEIMKPSLWEKLLKGGKQ